MRFTAFFGCLVTAIDCAQSAVKGDGAIFSADYSWLYWILVVIWVVSGFRILFVGTEA